MWGRPNSDTGGEFYPLLTRPVAAQRTESSGSWPPVSMLSLPRHGRTSRSHRRPRQDPADLRGIPRLAPPRHVPFVVQVCGDGPQRGPAGPGRHDPGNVDERSGRQQGRVPPAANWGELLSWLSIPFDPQPGQVTRPPGSRRPSRRGWYRPRTGGWSGPRCMRSPGAGRGLGAGVRASMATVIIGGQMLSMVPALLVTPVFCALLDMWDNWTYRMVSASRSSSRRARLCRSKRPGRTRPSSDRARA